MMLEAEVRGVIAERQQEVVMRVVRRAKQRDGFRHDAFQRRCQLRTDRQIRVVVGSNVNLVRRIRRQRNHQKVFAG